MAQNSGKKGGKPTPQLQEEELEETLQEQVNRLSAELTGHKRAAHKLSSTLATYGERLKLLEDSRTDTVDPAIRTLRGDVAELRAFSHGSSSRHDEQERQLADAEAAIKELSDKGHPVPGALAHLLESLTDTLGAIRQATTPGRAEAAKACAGRLKFNRTAPKGPGAFTAGGGPSRHDRRAEDDPVAKFNRLDRTSQRDLVNSFFRGQGN